MSKRHILTVCIEALLCILTIAPAVVADDRNDMDSKRRYDRGHASEGQQDQVRDALKRNEIRPLSEIIAAALKAVPGQVVGVEVKRRSGRLVYEIKIIAARGRVREVYVDAATLDIVKIE